MRYCLVSSAQQPIRPAEQTRIVLRCVLPHYLSKHITFPSQLSPNAIRKTFGAASTLATRARLIIGEPKASAPSLRTDLCLKPRFVNMHRSAAPIMYTTTLPVLSFDTRMPAYLVIRYVHWHAFVVSPRILASVRRRGLRANLCNSRAASMRGNLVLERLY